MNLYAYVRGNPVNAVDPRGLFSTYDAVKHYFFGGGREVTVDFSEIDVGLQPKDFEGYTAIVNSMYKKQGSKPVDLRAQVNFSASPSLAWAGNQRYRLKGEIDSNECEWNFSGYIGAFDNPFDFNELPWGQRNELAEIITRDIGFYGPMLGGQDYNITFSGRRVVHDGGVWE